MSQERIQLRKSRTSCDRTGPASRKHRVGEEAQDHQDESAEKESDHPGVEISQIQHTQRTCREETIDAATGTNVPEGAKDC